MAPNPPQEKAMSDLLPSVPSSRPAAPEGSARQAALAVLRRRVERIEQGAGLSAARRPVLETGAMAVDRGLPGGGLVLAGLHEVAMARADGAGIAFTAVLAARRAALDGRPVLWCTARCGLYGPGLAAFGLTPARLLLVRCRNDEERLWAMEEALRCDRLAAVVGEVRRLDLRQSRRLHLAAEGSGVTGLLLRPPDADLGAAAALTRWRAASMPGHAAGGHAGVGAPRIRLELLRARGGTPADWCLEWRDDHWETVRDGTEEAGQTGVADGGTADPGPVAAVVAGRAALARHRTAG
jgi:protein ImuA